MNILSITGTKGKTTVTRGIAFVLHSLGMRTLRVDTDGHYVNERRKSTLQDSRNLFNKAPTVCPGKFLITMKPYYPDFTAVLETALGSNGVHGLGYGSHSVGIFTNVFEDHLGIGRLKTREDLAAAKSFIFRQIGEHGTAVFNADDPLVCEQLKALPADKGIRLLPVGFDFSSFDVERHIREGGSLVTTKHDAVIIRTAETTTKVVDVRDIPWTFGGTFKPSLFNLMFIVAGLHAIGTDVSSRRIAGILRRYVPDREGGRLTLLRNDEGVTILIDYAHEKRSLLAIAELGNSLKTNRLIGVVRLAPDRTDAMIRETGRDIARSFDRLIVYDKIDGVTRGRFVGKNTSIVREIGEVSALFENGILENMPRENVERILVEERAIRRSSEKSGPGDVVVVICGDDHVKTLRWVKKYFKAKYAR